MVIFHCYEKAGILQCLNCSLVGQDCSEMRVR